MTGAIRKQVGSETRLGGETARHTDIVNKQCRAFLHNIFGGDSYSGVLWALVGLAPSFVASSRFLGSLVGVVHALMSWSDCWCSGANSKGHFVKQLPFKPPAGPFIFWRRVRTDDIPILISVFRPSLHPWSWWILSLSALVIRQWVLLFPLNQFASANTCNLAIALVYWLDEEYDTISLV